MSLLDILIITTLILSFICFTTSILLYKEKIKIEKLKKQIKMGD